MSGTITLNTPVVFNTNVQVFNESALVFNYEYNLNVTDLLVTSAFFDQARYRQWDETNNTYMVDTVTLLETANIATNKASMSTANGKPGTPGAGILAGNDLTVGQRIVEIMALKIFGNARAKAAIANDTAIEATSWKSPLEVVFNTDRNLIFEQYVGLDRVEPRSDTNSEYNDTDKWQSFNFSGLSFVVPVHLSLDSMDDDGKTGSLTTAAKTGPQVGSTTQLSNGTLSNCPVKLTITIA